LSSPAERDGGALERSPKLADHLAIDVDFEFLHEVKSGGCLVIGDDYPDYRAEVDVVVLLPDFSARSASRRPSRRFVFHLAPCGQ
jgi:hypothetical protein